MTLIVQEKQRKYEEVKKNPEINKVIWNEWLIGTVPKKQALEVRYALFEYFVHIGSSLKGRLPQLILLSKAKQLDEESSELKRRAGDKPEELKFTRQWLQKGCEEHIVSLKYIIPTIDVPSLKQKEKKE